MGSPDIAEVVKSLRGWALARMSEKRKAYTVLVGKPERDCLKDVSISGRIIKNGLK
jgi:hypothetical protein